MISPVSAKTEKSVAFDTRRRRVAAKMNFPNWNSLKDWGIYGDLCIHKYVYINICISYFNLFYTILYVYVYIIYILYFIISYYITFYVFILIFNLYYIIVFLNILSYILFYILYPIHIICFFIIICFYFIICYSPPAR